MTALFFLVFILQLTRIKTVDLIGEWVASKLGYILVGFVFSCIVDSFVYYNYISLLLKAKGGS